ncbi:ABC transporter permease [Acidocella sp.]|uniref:ABC transporter permease n=1 Tax=Acidocella sp. TaxID=50710 RepID=UPI00262F509F|nr:ABC transporter permease [Acidocella sp.]
MRRMVEILAPYGFGALALGGWQAAVWGLHVPPYVMPGPAAIVSAYFGAHGVLDSGLLATLAVTGAALLVAAMLGLVLALLMAASPLFRAAIQPWAVIIQVTPVVALAPFIIIWVNQPFACLVICAVIVAFFPILSNTAAGLAATPQELLDLFRLNGASRWQILFQLSLPYALPDFLTGLRISGTLALVGAVVAEFVAGSGGFASGLAWQIIEASYRLEIPRMFAALVLLGMTGVAIYAALGLLEHLLLAKRNRA